MAQPLKISCPSCSSKFHIPLHLVRGKVVSFRCKKCKGTIPVDGRAISTATPQPLPAPHVTPPEGWMGQRPSSPPPDVVEPRAPMYSEPPMRLSISDGLVVHGNGSMPSTTGLQVDTPAAFAHSNSPSQRPAVPGASRTPPWGLGAPSAASAPPPPLSRTEPPEAIRRSDPPPSFRGSPGRGKKVAGGIALVAAVGLSLWSMSVSRTPSGAAATPVAQADRPAPMQAASEPKGAAAEPAHAAPVPAPAEPVKPSMPVVAAPVKEPEPAPTKPARAAKGRAAKPAPAPAEAPAEVAPAAEEPAAPLSPSAAAAQEATNSAAQEIDFNKEAARQAIEDAGQRAASCRTIDTPAGAARVAVTFSPAGNVTSAVIESGPFVGTSAGGCVASKFRSVRVPAFTGEPVTVRKSVSF